MSSDREFDRPSVALFFLDNNLPFSDIQYKLKNILQQSIPFSEIYLISDQEYIHENSLIKQYESIKIYNIRDNGDTRLDWFFDILHKSNCSQVIIMTGNAVWKTKYSLEKFCLQAKVSEQNVFKCDNSFIGIETKGTPSLFGCIDDFVFSTDFLLEKRICLKGLSDAAQSMFIIDALGAAGEREKLFHIIGNDFSNRAENWAISLTKETFSSGIILCKNLLEIADKYCFSELAKAAEKMAENIVKVSGKFVSPFDKDSKEGKELHSLLENLAESLLPRTDLQNAEGLSTEIINSLKRPLVSVIVPVYNSERELQRCLSSIFSQSLKSIEVICVNDGSKDNSLEILRKNEQNHHNMRVMSQENSGQATARNRAISVATGKYLGFVDSDDWVESNMFETMAMELEQHPKAQIVKCGVHCDFDYPVSDTERRGAESYFAEPETRGIHHIDCHSLLTGVIWDKLYRTSLIKDNKIKFPEGVKNEDEAFALFCVCHAEFYILLKEKFYHYIKNQSGTMNTQIRLNLSGRVPDVFDVCNLMLDFLLAEKMYSYIGRVLKTILGAADRFEGSVIDGEIKHAVYTLLNKAQFQLYADTIVPEKRAWCRRKAAKYLNLYYDKPFTFKDLSIWLPNAIDIKPVKSSVCPKVSFIVPVYNVEQFLVSSIESLRNQTLFNIEILCIDDGSQDKSLEILEHYQQIDSRIRVITQTNCGVSLTRNRGLEEAKGEYVAFVDGDDIVLPEMAEKCIVAATKFNLDVVAFDYCCFDCQTGKNIDHYWTISNRHKELPINQVFDAESFAHRQFSFYGSSCVFLWRISFLKERKLYFPQIKISEDLCFVVNALSENGRFMILPEVLYKYRRNVPGSAITALKSTHHDHRLDTVPEICRLIEDIDKKKISSPAKANIIGRLLSEMRYFSTLSEPLKCCVEKAVRGKRDLLPSYIPSMCDNGLKNWVNQVLNKEDPRSDTISERKQKEVHLPELNKVTAFLWSRLEKRRKSTEHDLIVVISFLGSKTADPVDSWTFFSWLQEHKIPSCFVTNANSVFYRDLVKKEKRKDVIALKKSCLQDDHAAYFLKKLFVPLSRAKAVVFEDFVWPWPLRARFKSESWKLIFLQHGVSYFRKSKKLQEMFSRFNIVNTSSEKEKAFLSREYGCYEINGVPCPRYIVAGFPRWDRLLSTSSLTEKSPVVFIMFTWRDIFEKPGYKIKDSAYFNGIRSLLNSSILSKLKGRGVKVVFAPHHHLLDIDSECVKDWPVEICQQKDIAYWVKNASCLITDHSSIAWDFLFQKKPVIYWALDCWDLSLGDEELSQLAFVDKQIRGISKPVYTLAELQERLLFYADNDFKPAKEELEKLEQFFPYHDGFSQRVYENLCCDTKQKGTQN